MFSFGFVRDSDMEPKMKKFVLDLCVSNLEKFSDNASVEKFSVEICLIDAFISVCTYYKDYNG